MSLDKTRSTHQRRGHIDIEHDLCRLSNVHSCCESQLFCNLIRLEYHTDTTVRFVVKLSSSQYSQFNDVGLHKSFRLQDTFKLTNMVLFDHNGILRRYRTPEEICDEFFAVRLQMYVKRKDYLVGTLSSQYNRLDNIARFIKEKIDNTISIENKKISAVVDMLVERKYAKDPERVWREEARKKVERIRRGT
jgi:DNA topoisomerase II